MRMPNETVFFKYMYFYVFQSQPCHIVWFLHFLHKKILVWVTTRISDDASVLLYYQKDPHLVELQVPHLFPPSIKEKKHPLIAGLSKGQVGG